jgi:hypothetical protein
MRGFHIHAVGMSWKMGIFSAMIFSGGLAFVMIFLNLSAIGQNEEIRSFQKVLFEGYGDLDGDGIDEKVEVFDTTDTTALGTIRIIRISKKVGIAWHVLEQSEHAIYRSQEGGMVGEPLKSIEIKDQQLVIEHHGGSGWKWGGIDKYVYMKGAFQLVFFTTYYGQQCEYWQQFDFDILTRRVTYKKVYQKCEGELCNEMRIETERFKAKNPHLNLQNRNLTELRIVSPKYKVSLYL